MPEFNYQARNPAGEAQQGRVTAPDRRSAVRDLQARSLTPVRVDEAAAVPAGKPGKAAAPPRTAYRVPKGGIKLPTRVVLQFSIDLRDLLNAGLTLGGAVQKLARQTGNAPRAVLLKEVHEDIVQGKSLSEALAKHPKSFPEFYVSLVRAGEASGQLTSSLENAVRHYERTTETRDQVKNAMTYPIIVLFFGVVVVMYLLWKVVPKFAEIFESIDQVLPLPTRILIGLSEGMMIYGPLVAGVLALIAVFFSRWKKTRAGRLAWHGFLLKLPVFNKLVRSAAYANFARTLSNLLINGVPVLQSLDIVKSTANNAVLEEEIAKLKDRVTDGSSLSRPLSESGVFPDLFIDMLSVGEEAGEVPRALSRIAERYDGELTRDVKRMTTLIEPVLMLFMAAAIGFIAISMLLPVFTLSQGLR